MVLVAILSVPTGAYTTNALPGLFQRCPCEDLQSRDNCSAHCTACTSNSSTAVIICLYLGVFIQRFSRLASRIQYLAKEWNMCSHTKPTLAKEWKSGASLALKYTIFF